MCEATTITAEPVAPPTAGLDHLMRHLIGLKGVRLDRQGKLQLPSTLPEQFAPLPEALVPDALLRHLRDFREGRVSALPAPKRHNIVSRLRRYRLLDPPNRTCKKDMSREERLAYDRNYLRRWRQQKKTQMA